MSKGAVPVKTFLFIILLSLLITSACTKKNGAKTDPLVARGKALYMTTCTACHNTNAKIDGALGPASAGASLELLMARIKKAEYPAGYTAKRTTNLMVPLPQLSDADIKAIHSFLNSGD